MEEIKEVTAEVMEKEIVPTMRAFGKMTATVEAAVCCGCVCKDYCIKNKAAFLKMEELIKFADR
ncbi:hypothetical protein KY317_03780 [Candidatus Woesearchaeota archaeon]|nr:hypothetical protein [Candidatus Woesearchaeota archaeon]